MTVIARSVLMPFIIFCSGLVQLAHGGAYPVLEQDHYRWRSDNGGESGATWKAGADAVLTGVTRGVNIRLRFCVSNTGSASGVATPRLEYGSNQSGPWVQPGECDSGLEAFEITTSTNYISGDGTTALLAGTGTFVPGSCVAKPSSLAPAATINTNQYSNFEFCLQPGTKARGNTTYYFRVQGLSAYTRYGTLTMAAGEANEPPVLVAPFAMSASLVGNCTYTLKATGSEPITYGVRGLPAGFVFDGTNTVKGVGLSAGTYYVPVTASNYCGFNSNTMVITVAGDLPPVASNQTTNVVQGGEISIPLAWSDPDQSQATQHTFAIVSGPVHGTLESYSNRGMTGYPERYYYRAATNFTGTDIFTWKCNDGFVDSTTGTCTITVTANHAPVATGSSVSVPSGGACSINLPCSDQDSAQSLIRLIAGTPAHGTLSLISGTTVPYTPDGGYTGADSFTWRAFDGVAWSGLATVTVSVVAGSVPLPKSQTAVVFKDAASEVKMSFTGGGGLSSVLDLISGPSFGTVITNGYCFRYTPQEGYLGYDTFVWRVRYNSTGITACATCTVKVVESSGDWQMFRGNANRDSVLATNLPVNMTVLWRRDFQSVADDGNYSQSTLIDPYHVVVEGKTAVFGCNTRDCIWAMDTDTGTMKWTFFADGPVRTPPMIVNGRVFAGSDDGFFYCLNASNGAVLWKKRGGPSNRKVLGDRRLISVWPSRAGALAVGGNVQFLAGLWPVEGVFLYSMNPATGAVNWLNDSLGALPVVMPHGGVALGGLEPQGFMALCGTNSDSMYLPSSWAWPLEAAVSTGRIKPWHQEHKIGGPLLDYTGICFNQWGGVTTAYPLAIETGSRIITAADAAASGVAGSITGMSAGDGKLFVITRAGNSGTIWCCGENQPANTVVWTDPVTPLAPTNDAWTTRVASILPTLSEANGVCLVLGVGDGRAVEELVRQAPAGMQFVAVDPDTNKVAALRVRFNAAKVYGTRVSVHGGDPMNFGLPPYLGRLIVCADPAAAGFANGPEFVRNLFNTTRPYGGAVWLLTQAGEHTTLAGWVSSANLTNATLVRNGEFSVLTRNGSLPGAIDLNSQTLTNFDRNVYGPFGVLWFDGQNGSLTDGGHWGTAWPDISAGAMIGGDGTALDVYSGLSLTNRTYVGAGKNINSPFPADYNHSPLFKGLLDIFRLYPVGGGGCGGLTEYAGLQCWRIGNASYADRFTGARAVKIAGIRTGCGGGDHMLPANGVFSIPGVGGCSCAYALTKKAVTLVHRDDVEVWDYWGVARWQKTLETDPVKCVGINLGAPAERVDTNGTLWVSQPGGISYLNCGVAVQFEPSCPTRYWHHMSRITSGPSPAWVAASGVKGVTKISVPVAWPVVSRVCSAAPAIDGRTDDSCWDGKSAVTLMREEPEGPQTDHYGSINPYMSTRLKGKVQVRYDAKNLYFVCEALDRYTPDAGLERWVLILSDASKVIGSTDDSRGGGAVRGGAERALQFAVDPSGNRESSRSLWKDGSAFDTSWIGVWRGAATSSTNTFVAEFAIPWSTLSDEGINTNSLIINIKGPGQLALRADSRSGISYNECNAFYSPLTLDTAYGLMASGRPYSVNLHFAETEGAQAGARVFDVKLNGVTVLHDLDVFQEAGGADISIVRSFPNIMVSDNLDVEFVPKKGEAMISGIELLGNFSYTNHAPEITPNTGAPFVIEAGSSKTLSLLRMPMPDVDGDALTYRWSYDGAPLTNGLLEDQYCTTKWNFAPAASNAGAHTIVVTADDGHGGVTSYRWDALVLASNQPPVINSDLAIQAVVGTPVRYHITATSLVSSVYSVSGLPGWLSFDGMDTLSGIPAEQGTASVSITASNAWGADSKVLTVTVASNQAPVVRMSAWPLRGAAPLVVTADAMTSFDPDGTLKQEWYWDYGDGMTSTNYSWSAMATGFATHTYSSTGTYVLTACAYDDAGAVGTTSTTITVLPSTSNTPPTAVSQWLVTTQNAARAVTLSATDPNSGTTLTYLVSDQPRHGMLNVLTNKNLIYTPEINYTGTDSFTFKANDGKEDSNTGTVYVTVRSDTRAPFFTVSPLSSCVPKGSTPVFVVVAGGGSPMTYQWMANEVPISGATNANFTHPPVSTIDNGKTLMVLAANPYGAATSAVATLTVLNIDPPPVPVALWAFDDGGGTNVLDNIGGHTGFVYGSDPAWIPGKFGSALDINQSSGSTEVAPTNYISIPDFTYNSSTGSTLSFWFKAAKNENANSSSWYRLIYHGSSSPGDLVFYMGNTGSDGIKSLSGADPGSSPWPGTSGTNAALNGQWHQVVAVFDSLASNITYYYDGVARTNFHGAVPGNPSGNLYFGRSTAATGSYPGSFDEIALWNTVLSSNDVTWLWNVGMGNSLATRSNMPPTIAVQPTANPAPVTGQKITLSVMGADDGDEKNLIYTWITNAPPPAEVLYSVNGNNAAKTTTVTFTTPGVYNFAVTIRDPGGLSVSGVLAVNVSPDANTNGLPDDWEVTNFGSTTNADGAAQADWDHDGMSNYSEWKAGTSPTNANSLLRMQGAAVQAGTNLVIKWSSESGKFYSILTSTNLLAGFDGWATNHVPATPSVNTSTVIVDQVGNRYYRVTVE